MKRTMALKKCVDCSKQISELAPSCPHCGRPQAVPTREQLQARNRARQQSNAFGLKVFGVGVVVVVLVVIISSTVNSLQEASRKRNAARAVEAQRAAATKWVMAA